MPGNSTDFSAETSTYVQGSVASYDPNDFYRMYTLFGSSKARVVLSGLSQQASLSIYDGDHNLLAGGQNGFGQQLVVDLPGREYIYFKVNAPSASTVYSLYIYNDYAGDSVRNAGRVRATG